MGRSTSQRVVSKATRYFCSGQKSKRKLEGSWVLVEGGSNPPRAAIFLLTSTGNVCFPAIGRFLDRTFKCSVHKFYFYVCIVLDGLIN